MASPLSDGPFLGTLNNRGRLTPRTPKRTTRIWKTHDMSPRFQLLATLCQGAAADHVELEGPSFGGCAVGPW